MTIESGEHLPIELKPYWALFAKWQIVHKAVGEMFAANIICDGGQLTIPGIPQEDSICASSHLQEGVRQTPEAVNNSAPGCGWDIRVVQQLCPSSKG